MGPGVFFDLEDRGTVKSTIYRDEMLKGPLMEFWEDAFVYNSQLILKITFLFIKRYVYPSDKNLG